MVKGSFQPMLTSGAITMATVVAVVGAIWVTYGVGTSDKAFARPATCINCFSVVGNGEGILTLPKNIASGPAFCIECAADIKFDAAQASKGTGGVVTVTLSDGTIVQGTASTVKVSSGQTRFVIAGTLTPVSGWMPMESPTFTLSGLQDINSGEWTLEFQTTNGIKGEFTGSAVITPTI